MRYQLVIKEFVPNIQHIYGVDNIVADMLRRLPYTPVKKYEPGTKKALCHANNLFTTSRLEKNEDCVPLKFLNVQREEQKYLRKNNYKLITYI